MCLTRRATGPCCRGQRTISQADPIRRKWVRTIPCRSRRSFPTTAGMGPVTGDSGNVIAVMSQAFSYDAENRIVNAAIPNIDSIGYAYDGDGRRVSKTVNGATTTFVYDASGLLAAEYGPGTDAGTDYLTDDALGSTRVVT